MLLKLSRRRQLKLAHYSALLNGTRDYLSRDELLTISLGRNLFGERRRREEPWSFRELPLRRFLREVLVL
jgi:hypothetical protein